MQAALMHQQLPMASLLKQAGGKLTVSSTDFGLVLPQLEGFQPSPGSAGAAQSKAALTADKIAIVQARWVPQGYPWSNLKPQTGIDLHTAMCWCTAWILHCWVVRVELHSTLLCAFALRAACCVSGIDILMPCDGYQAGLCYKALPLPLTAVEVHASQMSRHVWSKSKRIG